MFKNLTLKEVYDLLGIDNMEGDLKELDPDMKIDVMTIEEHLKEIKSNSDEAQGLKLLVTRTGHGKVLKPKKKIKINSPPANGRCQCCGRHYSEFLSLDDSGHPLGDFTGFYLFKKWRSFGPYDQVAEVAMQEANESYENDGFDDPRNWMINKYGKEKGERLYLTSEMYNTIGVSWECRDCALLDDNEYHDKLEQAWDF
jgi:hypothetical protein